MKINTKINICLQSFIAFLISSLLCFLTIAGIFTGDAILFLLPSTFNVFLLIYEFILAIFVSKFEKKLAILVFVSNAGVILAGLILLLIGALFVDTWVSGYVQLFSLVLSILLVLITTIISFIYWLTYKKYRTVVLDKKSEKKDFETENNYDDGFEYEQEFKHSNIAKDNYSLDSVFESADNFLDEEKYDYDRQIEHEIDDIHSDYEPKHVNNVKDNHDLEQDFDSEHNSDTKQDFDSDYEPKNDSKAKKDFDFEQIKDIVVDFEEKEDLENLD